MEGNSGALIRSWSQCQAIPCLFGLQVGDLSMLTGVLEENLGQIP